MSQRMTSTTVYLTEDQQNRLDAVRAATKRPKAVIIREGIDLALAQHGAPSTAGVLGGQEVVDEHSE